MHGPAGLAEDEVSDVDDTGDEVRGGLATLPTLDGFRVFHGCSISYFGGGVYSEDGFIFIYKCLLHRDLWVLPPPRFATY